MQSHLGPGTGVQIDGFKGGPTHNSVFVRVLRYGAANCIVPQVKESLDTAPAPKIVVGRMLRLQKFPKICTISSDKCIWSPPNTCTLGSAKRACVLNREKGVRGVISPENKRIGHVKIQLTIHFRGVGRPPWPCSTTHTARRVLEMEEMFVYVIICDA